MKTGIMGGTFDPIHIGHIFLAHEAKEVLGLDRVIFVPTGKGPHKPEQKSALAQHRLEMVRVAICETPYFEVTDLELIRPGYCYTVDTLDALRQLYPEDDFFFITGADAFLSIESWKQYEKLLLNMHFVAAYRPQDGLMPTDFSEKAGQLIERLGLKLGSVIDDHVHLMPMLGLAVSSSDIRIRRKKGLHVHGLVPEGVIDYMEAHQLYA